MVDYSGHDSWSKNKLNRICNILVTTHIFNHLIRGLSILSRSKSNNENHQNILFRGQLRSPPSGEKYSYDTLRVGLHIRPRLVGLDRTFSLRKEAGPAPTEM
jgi:hypothetical protein